MKKLFTSLVALAFVATASAQTVKNFTFEDGTTNGWKCWANKTNKVIETNVKTGKYAMDVAVGTYFQIIAKAPKTQYKISADVFDKWGICSIYAKVEYYDKKKNKIVEIIEKPVDQVKGHSLFELEFKSKVAGMHRITFAANKGRFQLDNVKLEVVK